MENPKGIGYNSAYNIIKKYGSISSAIKHSVIKNFEYKHIRNYINKPVVKEIDPKKLIMGEIDT